MFGLTLSLMEVLTLLGVFATLVGGWYKINQKLEDILNRNEKADKAHIILDKKVDIVETMLRKEIQDSRISTEMKLAGQEERLRVSDIFSGRLEEKFTFVEKQIGRILDILERESHNK